MIGDVNLDASTLHLLNSNALRFAPLTAGQLAARAMFGGGGGGAVSATSSEPLLNQKDPSKYPQHQEGMSTTTMAAIGIGVVAVGLVAYKLLGKKRR